MEPGSLLSRIEINPKVMVGKPVVRGTRIPVETIVRKLARNVSLGDILEAYPELSQEDVKAALEYAARALGTEEIHWLQSAE